MENMLRPGSYVGMGGGFKNNPVISSLFDDLSRFTGKDIIFRDVYGMTELCSSFEICSEGYFHIPPWVVPYVLDIDSGKVLPRKGRQKGRAAFFDLIMTSYWGGIITGDMIEVDWGQCPCGRNTPYILPTIKRAAESEGHFSGHAKTVAVEAAVKGLVEGLILAN